MKVLIEQAYFKIPLHFKNIKEETLQSDIFARCGRKISPPLLNARSIGELDAGTLRALIAGKYIYLMFGDVLPKPKAVK